VKEKGISGWLDDPQAADLWGRFYDLENNKVFFCDRDGIVRYDWQQISYERRTGYAWFTTAPAELFPLYKEWKKEL
jgi:pectinesterase